MFDPRSPRLGSVLDCVDELDFLFAINMSPHDCCAVVQKHVAHWHAELGTDAAATRAGEVYDAMEQFIAAKMQYLDDRGAAPGSPEAATWNSMYAPLLASISAARDAAARAAGYQSLPDLP